MTKKGAWPVILRRMSSISVTKAHQTWLECQVWRLKAFNWSMERCSSTSGKNRPIFFHTIQSQIRNSTNDMAILKPKSSFMTASTEKEWPNHSEHQKRILIQISPQKSWNTWTKRRYQNANIYNRQESNWRSISKFSTKYTVPMI